MSRARRCALACSRGFSELDIVHFDLYSVALSTNERGTERDFADVLALLQNGRLDL